MSLILGVLLLRRAGLHYLAPSVGIPLLAAGGGLLLACGVAAFRLARRSEYPLILALAAIALPLFEPSVAPYGVTDRVVFGVRDLLLLAGVVVYVVRSVRRGDQLERRIHLDALAWSYTAILIALVAQSIAADVLPPLRATWVASGMLILWMMTWVLASIRYQR